MINEREEFEAYRGKLPFAPLKKQGTAWMGRINFEMLMETKGGVSRMCFLGFPRVFTILARGYLYDQGGDPDPRLAYRALQAWCSIPNSKKASPGEDWKAKCWFPELHAEFPELVDENGVGWMAGFVAELCALVRERGDQVSAHAAKNCQFLESRFSDAWANEVIHFQVPLFSRNAAGEWMTSFQGAVADALELGSLRDQEVLLSPALRERIAQAGTKDCPAEILERLIRYYVANRQEGTPWVVINSCNLSAWLGSGKFRKSQKSHLPAQVIRWESRGNLARYQVAQDYLEGSELIVLP